MKAQDLLDTRRLSVVFRQTRVASLVRILKTTAHGAFPVVSVTGSNADNESLIHNDSQKENDQLEAFVNDDNSTANPLESIADMELRRRKFKFEGLILRSHIAVLLKKRIWYREGEEMPVLSYEEMTEAYPRYPDIHDILDSDIIPEAIVDISFYMNRCPYTVYPESPVPQVFALFRSMGLRHVPVVDHEGKIQGIITRHNLKHEFMEQKLERMQQQDRGPHEE